MVYDCFTNITLYIYILGIITTHEGEIPFWTIQHTGDNTGFWTLSWYHFHIIWWSAQGFIFFLGGWLQITKQFSSKQPNSLRCTAWTDFTQIILSGALFARRIFGDVELYLSALHEGDSWGGSSESRLSNVDHPRFIKLSSVFPVFF